MSVFNRVDASTIDMLFKKNDYATLRFSLIALTYAEDLLITKTSNLTNTYLIHYLYVNKERYENKTITHKYYENDKEWKSIYHRVKELIKEGNKGKEVLVEKVKIEDDKIEIEYTRIGDK